MYFFCCQLTITLFFNAAIIGFSEKALFLAICVNRRRYAPGLRIDCAFSRMHRTVTAADSPPMVRFASIMTGCTMPSICAIWSAMRTRSGQSRIAAGKNDWNSLQVSTSSANVTPWSFSATMAGELSTGCFG